MKIIFPNSAAYIENLQLGHYDVVVIIMNITALNKKETSSLGTNKIFLIVSSSVDDWIFFEITRTLFSHVVAKIFWVQYLMCIIIWCIKRTLMLKEGL